MDNLEGETYEGFEKDPIKYRQYEEAVYRALCDRSDKVITCVFPTSLSLRFFSSLTLESAEPSLWSARVEVRWWRGACERPSGRVVASSSQLSRRTRALS